MDDEIDWAAIAADVPSFPKHAALRYVVVSSVRLLDPTTFQQVLTANRIALVDIIRSLVLAIHMNTISPSNHLKLRARLLITVLRLYTDAPAISGTKVYECPDNDQTTIDTCQALSLAEISVANGHPTDVDLKRTYHGFITSWTGDGPDELKRDDLVTFAK
jgi:hypothetical protein